MKGLIFLILLAAIGFGGYHGYEYYQKQKAERKLAAQKAELIAAAPAKLLELLEQTELKRLGANMYRIPAEARKRYLDEARTQITSIEKRDEINRNADKIYYEKRAEILKIRIDNINEFLNRFNEIMREIQQPELSAAAMRELRGVVMYSQSDAATLMRLKGFNADLINKKDFKAMRRQLESNLPLPLKEQFAAGFFSRNSLLWREWVISLKKSEYLNRINYDKQMCVKYTKLGNELAMRIFDQNKHFFSWEYNTFANNRINSIPLHKREKFAQEQELLKKLLAESQERINVPVFEEACFNTMVHIRLLANSWKIPMEYPVEENKHDKNMTYAEITAAKEKALLESVELQKYPIPNYQFLEQVCLFPDRETDLKVAFESLKARYANCRSSRKTNELQQFKNVRDFFAEYNVLATRAKLRFFDQDEVESMIKANHNSRIDGWSIAEKYGVITLIDDYLQKKPSANASDEVMNKAGK